MMVATRRRSKRRLGEFELNHPFESGNAKVPQAVIGRFYDRSLFGELTKLG
jgi:hypothetical protein